MVRPHVTPMFCTNFMRRGGIGFIGAVDTSGYNNITDFLAGVYGYGLPVGEAFMHAKNGHKLYLAHWPGSGPGGSKGGGR